MTLEQSDSLFNIFVSCRSALVGYVVNILKSTKDAEDVVQETYLRLVNGQPGEKVVYPKAFVFRVARNLALDHLRRERRNESSLKINGGYINSESEVHNPEEWLLANEKPKLMLEAILKLPAKCRHVYTLRKLYGLSHHEIADRLGISVRTVENHIAKATRECRDYMKAHDEKVGNNTDEYLEYGHCLIDNRNRECC